MTVDEIRLPELRGGMITTTMTGRRSTPRARPSSGPETRASPRAHRFPEHAEWRPEGTRWPIPPAATVGRSV
jgi:hypothetical protein